MIDATEELNGRDEWHLREAVDAADGASIEVTIYGHTVALRDIGDACRCCEHDCLAGDPLYEAALVGRLHGRQLLTDADTLAGALDDIRMLLEPERIDTEAGRQRYQLAENARTRLQPTLLAVSA